MCSPPPPLLPRTDNLKFWLVGHHDLNPPHHHDNSSSQPPTSVWNLKWFFLDVGVSAVQISQSCSSSERGTDFILHPSFFFGLSPSQSIYELKEAKPNVVKDAFFLVWSLSMFFFFSICNILSEECFEVLTPCLFSNITPVALNVYPKNLTNKWLQPQFPLSTVPHCKM